MDVQQIKSLLEQAQWVARASRSDDVDESPCCFKCGAFEPGPHKEGCELAVAIEGIALSPGKDAFDCWWDWAEKPLDSDLTISAEIHNAMMTLTPEERRDRQLVNQVVREGRGPLRPAGSADRYGVPRATE